MKNERTKAGLINYISMDLRRAFFNWKCPVAVGSIYLLLLYSNNLCFSMVDRIRWMVGNMTFIVVALMLAAAPYAASLCDEAEYKYSMQAVLRGSEGMYYISKVLVTFFSSAVVMLSAFLLDAATYYWQYGLPEAWELEEHIRANPAYTDCLVNGNYVGYVLLTGLQLAALAGSMAVIGLVCSVFVQNRMLVYAFPVAVVYVWDMMAIRFLGYDVGCAVTLYQMGVGTIKFQFETQSRLLYYIEVLMVVVCGAVIICTKQKKK